MDDFLAAMGITPEEPPQSSQQLLGDAEPTVTVPEQPQQTHELTASDFNDILDDLGFNPPDAEAEEIVEDENEYVRDVATDLLIHPSIADNAELMEAIRTLDENGILVILLLQCHFLMMEQCLLFIIEMVMKGQCLFHSQRTLVFNRKYILLL